MSTQEKLYLIITNKDNKKCLFLTPKEISPLPITNPEIVYDGKDHAILYRNNKESILLDYLPKPLQSDLAKLKELLVVEYDVNKKDIANEYIAKMTILKTMPDISKDLKIKK